MIKHKRRVIITLELNGSTDDAQEAQDTVGEAIDDEFLGAILTDLAESRGLDITWTVKGERWEPASTPTPDRIHSAMQSLNETD